jgi:hypothetical protein
MTKPCTPADTLKNELGELALVNGWNSFREPFGDSMRFQKQVDSELVDLHVKFRLDGTIRSASFNGQVLPPLYSLVLAILG